MSTPLSSRARALAYDAQVKAKKAQRSSARPDNFGKTGKSGPPSYAFQDAQRGPVDNVSEEVAPVKKELDALQDDDKADEVDATDFTAAAPTGKARPATKTTAAGPSAAPAPAAKAAFMKCWTTVDEIDIPAVSEDQKSFWTPNSIKIFLILFQMELLLFGNEQMKWVSPNYFSLPVRIYYSVIFYVQTLRAKEQAGKLAKSEGSWLRAFFRRFKDTMLPIAGPLIPAFSNIVSVLPEDSKFEYVYPQFGNEGGFTSPGTAGVMTVLAQHHLLPCTRILTQMFKAFTAINGNITATHEEDGNFVPFQLGNGGNFCGYTFPAQTAAAPLPAAAIAFLSNIVINQPLPEDRATMNRIKNFWRRSRLNSVYQMQPNVAYAPANVADIVQMTEDFDWFQPCVDMANVQTKFFTDGTTLANIPTVGGNSATVDCSISSSTATVPTASTTWFGDYFATAKARYRSSDPTLDVDDKFNAIFALTNAKLNWTVDGHHVGSRLAEHRSGPYWNNKNYQYQADHDTSIAANLYSMVQTEFYDYDGKQ